MDIWIKLILISAIVCYVIDISGIIDSIKFMIWKRLFKKQGSPNNIRLKPFDCSLCSVWWTNLIYLFVTNNLSLILIFEAAMLSMFSSNITGFLNLIKDTLITIENKIYNKLN